MSFLPSPERLARFSTRRPWTVVALWTVLLLGGLFAATSIGDVVTTSNPNYRSTDSERADQLVANGFAGGHAARETIVVQSARSTVDDRDFRFLVEGLVRDLRDLDGDVVAVDSYYESPAPGLVSSDGRTLLVPVTLAVAADDAAEHIEGLMGLTAALDGANGFTVVSGGDGTASRAFDEQSEKDLQKAEVLGLPIALVILIVVFGALVAAGIPILVSLISIVVAVGISALIGRAFGLSIFVVNMITMMGMAVGVDYCLIVIQRFREERALGVSRDDAILRSSATASRSVLFSGLTVVVALAGMLLVPNGVFRSLSVGAMVVVLVAVAASLSLLPAVLRLLGDRVNAGKLRIPGRKSPDKSQSRFWDVASGAVMRHPVLSVVASVGLLLAAAAPYATVELGWFGPSSLPENTEARRAFDILESEFSAGVISPTEIVISSQDVTAAPVEAAVERLLAAIALDTEFGTPVAMVTNDAETLLVLRIPLAGDPMGGEATEAVSRLRESYIPQAFAATPARALVTGATATSADDTSLITGSILEVFVFILGFSFIILLLVFRSIVVPLKALVMNLLSVGAAYGLMVLVFQHGVGNELFGFQHVRAIEAWVPLFMFSVLFGLSMDYHVFLLTRIRERFEQTRDNGESVRYGVQHTAGMITGAAAIMVAVFAGFASGELVALQQMGFGLAVAVLLDASIVRVVLVPASMQLLGDRNWYFPGWLAWLPRIDVEGTPSTTPRHPVQPHRESLGLPATD
jgi:RND superfamily putative drug exporter